MIPIDDDKKFYNKNLSIQEKKEIFLESLRHGYSKQVSFRRSGFSIYEWDEILANDEDFIKKAKEVEKEYFSFLDNSRKVEDSIVYSPDLDNYRNINLQDNRALEDAVYKMVLQQALRYPNNPIFSKNAISLISRSVGLRAEREMSKEEQIHKIVNEKRKDYLEFVEAANYPRPYPKQLEMRDFANQDGIKLILAARKYGKTDYLTILNTAYKIMTIPDYSAMIITKEEKRGKDICRSIKQACEDNGVEFEVKSSEQLRVRGKFGKEASLIVIPVGSSGYRGHHVNEIIMDDPIVPTDRNSPANRQRVLDLYNESVNLTGSILVIGQPVHQKDLYAVLKDSSLDMGKVKLMEVPHGSIPELDTDLVMLRNTGVSEEAIGANYLLKLRSDGILPFYNCVVRPNDQVFNPDGNYSNYRTELWVDPSKRASGRDYTAIAVLKLTDDYCYICGFAWKRPYNELLSELKFICQAYEVQKVYFEMNGLADDSLIRLKEWGINNVVGFNTKENKEKKISALTYIADKLILCRYVEVENAITIKKPTGEDEEVRLISPNKEFNKMFKEYEIGLPDDCVDTVSSWLLQRNVINVEIGKEYKV